MICGHCSIYNYSHDQNNHYITTLSYSDREREGGDGGRGKREEGEKRTEGVHFFLGGASAKSVL